jgi:hypothetical protein
MRFIRIQESQRSWISDLRQQLTDLMRPGGENRRGINNSVLDPDGVSIVGLQGAERKNASRKRGRYESSPSTAEVALWQLLLLRR